VTEDCLGDGFYNFLRWFVSEKLIEMNKYVIHASCVLGSDGLAHIFLGHSGAGKTTITKLSSPRKVLGDDMNIISFGSEGDVVVEAGAIGGLFNSMIGYGVQTKIKGFYWLQKSDSNKLIEIEKSIASQRLLSSFANLHWPTLSSSKEEHLISVSILAAKNTKFYQLNFKKDSSFWDLIE
jgi:hypothetical protein